LTLNARGVVGDILNAGRGGNDGGAAGDMLYTDPRAAVGGANAIEILMFGSRPVSL